MAARKGNWDRIVNFRIPEELYVRMMDGSETNFTSQAKELISLGLQAKASLEDWKKTDMGKCQAELEKIRLARESARSNQLAFDARESELIKEIASIQKAANEKEFEDMRADYESRKAKLMKEDEKVGSVLRDKLSASIQFCQAIAPRIEKVESANDKLTFVNKLIEEYSRMGNVYIVKHLKEFKSAVLMVMEPVRK